MYVKIICNAEEKEMLEKKYTVDCPFHPVFQVQCGEVLRCNECIDKYLTFEVIE